MTIGEALQILKPFKACMIDQHGCPISDAAIALDVVIKELENKEWTPCSERLPEEGEVVLTQAKFKDDVKMAVSARVDFNYWTGWGTREINIIAWMPLPDPWKEGESNG